MTRVHMLVEAVIRWLDVDKLAARVRVLLTAAVTWLLFALAVVQIIIGELDGIAGIPAGVLEALARVVSVLTVAIVIIRRVTTVLPEARGLLDNGRPLTDLEAIGAAAISNAIERPPADRIEN